MEQFITFNWYQNDYTRTLRVGVGVTLSEILDWVLHTNDMLSRAKKSLKSRVCSLICLSPNLL